MTAGPKARATAPIIGRRSSPTRSNSARSPGGEYGAAYLTAYQTRDQLAQYFAGIKRDWEMIEYVTEHFVAQGDRVVMLGHCSWRNRRTGKVVATPKADSWRFADGKAIEFYEYYDTAQLRDAAV